MKIRSALLSVEPLLSPTPMYIFLILVTLTPVMLLSGIFHSVQSLFSTATGSGCTNFFDLPALSSDLEVQFVLDVARMVDTDFRHQPNLCRR